MQNFRLLLLLVFSFAGKALFAQNSATIKEYIEKYKDFAIREEIRTGVPAAITLAQGIHETEAGKSDLVQRSNNHFGIKCKTGWTGESVTHTDDAPNECFRKYDDPEQSYRDHSDFLKTGQRYAFLFNLAPLDYEGWANGLKKAGYATNPRYPAILIKLIEDYHLQDYTLIAMGKLPADNNAALVVNKNANNDAIVTAVEKENAGVAVNYPAGEFRLNETKVVFAKKNTPYLTLAQQYNISLKRLFEFNDNMPEEETVAFDQLIYLQRKRKTGLNEFHIVQKGETIYDIAQTEAIRLESLLEYNMLTEDADPAAGEKLYLRTKAPARPKLATSTAMNSEYEDALAINTKVDNLTNVSSSYAVAKSFMHVVKPKESLNIIAKKYSVSVNDIMEWNQLNSDYLKVGQQIKILK